MGNKQILTQNNETLATVLSNVLGLPSQERLKHGAYVWKKCATSYTESSTSKAGTVTLVSNTQSGAIKAYYSTAYTFDNTTGHFELSNPTEITVGYGEGYTFSNGNVYITLFSPSSIEMVKLSNNRIATLYNDSNGIYINTDTNYSHTYYENEVEYTFINFVVSDSVTAYPDGGEQGGYWYEIFKEKLTPSLFGFTKVAVDTFSFTSTTTITTGTVLNHSLGEVPRMWLILSTEPTVFHQTKAVKGYIAYLGGNGLNASGGVIYEDSTTSNGNQASSTAIPNSTQIPFTYDSILTNKYFIAGVQYTLITMA